MKLSDFVADTLNRRGIKHVFGLTGGAVVHLFDSVSCHPEMKAVFTHHEQTAAFAAEAYSKTAGFGACFCTTGPGVTNAITGLAAAWLDSVPCIFISGQARYSHTTAHKKIRQVGTQQLHILPIVNSLTKYSVMLEDPNMIRYELEKALYISSNGRPGPVWLDIPLDFQWADIDPESIPKFSQEKIHKKSYFSPSDGFQTSQFIEYLETSFRPLFVIGRGLCQSPTGLDAFNRVLKATSIPFVATWGGVNSGLDGDSRYLGRIGVAGQRGANFAVQNSDFLIVLGSHLCIPITGNDRKQFAREAKIVMVNLDEDELKEQDQKVNLTINQDCGLFLDCLGRGQPLKSGMTNTWVEHCEEYKKLNSFAYKESCGEYLDQYAFLKQLARYFNNDEHIVVDGGGTNVYISFQCIDLKGNQKLILSTGLCSMGSGLGEAIGVCFGNNLERTVCLVGDGSLQLNIQELQTIYHHNLPIKIVCFNNQGYNSIRQTQNSFLGGRTFGSEAKFGMSLPNYLNIVQGYGIKGIRISDTKSLDMQLEEFFNAPGPCYCEVMISPDQEVNPTQAFNKQCDGTFRPRPLEDMNPLLPRELFNNLMIVKHQD